MHVWVVSKCMYICAYMNVYTYKYMVVCGYYVFVYVHICTCICVGIGCVCTYMCTYICVCVRIYVWLPGVRTCMWVVCMRIYVDVSVQMYASVYVCVCMVSVYMDMYECIHV